MLRQPALRTELATLQQELAPLNAVFESSEYGTVEPPKHLAKRTCDSIWAKMDREELRVFDENEDKTVVCPSSSSPFLSHDATAEVASFISHEGVSVSKRLMRRYEKKERKSILGRKKVSASNSPGGRWRIDLIASVAVGILMAVIAFPTVNYVKNRATNFITQSKVHEINQRIDRFAELQSGFAPTTANADEKTAPFDLSQLVWQELKPDQFPLFVVSDPSPSLLQELATDSAFSLISEVDNLLPGAAQTQGTIDTSEQDGGIFLGQARQDSYFSPPFTLSSVSLQDVGQILPVPGNSPLRTVYGQNVLFRNGKVFIRQMPIVPASK